MQPVLPAGLVLAWRMAATSGGLVAPLFAERYWCQPTDAPCDAPTPLQAVQPGCRDPQLSPTKAASRMGNLRVLDLRTLPRDDGPPTELRARKEKLAFFERQCSRVAEGLYVGAEHVARSRDTLREAGITHVVNCVGFLYPPYFENELRYQVLYLQGRPSCGLLERLPALQAAAADLPPRSRCIERQHGRPVTGSPACHLLRLLACVLAGCLLADTPGEDILCVLYDVFDFIEVIAAVSQPDAATIHCHSCTFPKH